MSRQTREPYPDMPPHGLTCDEGDDMSATLRRCSQDTHRACLRPPARTLAPFTPLSTKIGGFLDLWNPSPRFDPESAREGAMEQG
jgi:hypothetical protein